jgi:hypothetical protein
VTVPRGMSPGPVAGALLVAAVLFACRSAAPAPAGASRARAAIEAAARGERDIAEGIPAVLRGATDDERWVVGFFAVGRRCRLGEDEVFLDQARAGVLFVDEALRTLGRPGDAEAREVHRDLLRVRLHSLEYAGRRREALAAALDWLDAAGDGATPPVGTPPAAPDPVAAAVIVAGRLPTPPNPARSYDALLRARVSVSWRRAKERLEGTVRGVEFPEFRFDGSPMEGDAEWLMKTGFADSDGEVRPVIVVRDAALALRDAEFVHALAHEGVHLLHHALVDMPEEFPPWVAEGLAIFLSDADSAFRAIYYEQAYLVGDPAADSPLPGPWFAPDGGAPEGDPSPHLRGIASFDGVRLRRGDAATKTLVQALLRGEAPRDAFARALGTEEAGVDAALAAAAAEAIRVHAGDVAAVRRARRLSRSGGTAEAEAILRSLFTLDAPPALASVLPLARATNLLRAGRAEEARCFALDAATGAHTTFGVRRGAALVGLQCQAALGRWEQVRAGAERFLRSQWAAGAANADVEALLARAREEVAAPVPGETPVR